MSGWLYVGSSVALGVLVVLAAVGAVCVLAETLWRAAGWLARRDERRERPW